MSTFQALVAGKGTNPLRLASSPVLIWLHAEDGAAGLMVMLSLVVAV
jgi:hypothetical protein